MISGKGPYDALVMVPEMLTKLRSPMQSAAEYGKEFAALRDLIKDAGLMKKQRFFYVLQYIWVASLLTLNIFILFSTRNLFVVFLNAALLSFTFGQIGMLLHDLGHQQVFSKKWKNTLQGYMYGFILGLSFPCYWLI